VSCSTGDALMQSNIEHPVVGEQMGTSPTRIPPEYARPHHPARDSRHDPYEQGSGKVHCHADATSYSTTTTVVTR
jgi:hypothetical protein